MTTYNPRTQRFTVWGAHADYANGSPIMLTSGTVPECRAESNFRRDAGGWTLLTVREGERPSESWLSFAREQAAKNPAAYDAYEEFLARGIEGSTLGSLESLSD